MGRSLMKLLCLVLAGGLLCTAAPARAAPLALSVHFTDSTHALQSTDTPGDAATAGSFADWNNIYSSGGLTYNGTLLMSNGSAASGVTMTLDTTNFAAPSSAPSTSLPTSQQNLMGYGLLTYGTGSGKGHPTSVQNNIEFSGLNSVFPNGYTVYIYNNGENANPNPAGGWTGVTSPSGTYYVRYPGGTWSNASSEPEAAAAGLNSFSGNWGAGNFEVDVAGSSTSGTLNSNTLQVSDNVYNYNSEVSSRADLAGNIITGIQIVGNVNVVTNLNGVWTGGGGTANTSWSTAANWSAAGIPGFTTPAPFDTADFPAGITNAAVILNVAGPVLSSITFNDGGGGPSAYSITQGSGSGNITLSGGSAAIIVDGGTSNSISAPWSWPPAPRCSPPPARASPWPATFPAAAA